MSLEGGLQAALSRRKLFSELTGRGLLGREPRKPASGAQSRDGQERCLEALLPAASTASPLTNAVDGGGIWARNDKDQQGRRPCQGKGSWQEAESSKEGICQSV